MKRYDYVDINNPNLFAELYRKEVVSKLMQKGYLGRTHRINKHTGQVELILEGGIEFNTPWVHVNQDPDRQCNDYYMIEDCFGFIPTKCLSCWKIVIRPQNVMDLFKLYNLMVKMNETEDVYCKCGIEITRSFVPALFGGYIYNNSEREGEKRLEQLRTLLPEYVPGATAYLKRYCSEFELKYGDSKGYNQPKDAKHWEEILSKIIKVEPKSDQQPQHLVDYVMTTWIKFAENHGDKISLKFTNNEYLYSQPRKYKEV